MADDRFALVDG